MVWILAAVAVAAFGLGWAVRHDRVLSPGALDDTDPSLHLLNARDRIRTRVAMCGDDRSGHST